MIRWRAPDDNKSSTSQPRSINVIEFIRETRENLQNRNEEFIAKLDERWRGLTGIISSKLHNALNNPWISRFYPLDDDTVKVDGQSLSPLVQKIYDQLMAQIGEETHVGVWHLITQEDINQFAGVTGDTQWIHTNPERAAKESPFRSTIAHGFYTLSLIPMLTDTVKPDHNPYPEARMVINYGLNRVRFPYPVKPGSRVRARTKLIEVIPAKRSIEVVNEVSIEIEHSARMACIADSVLRLYF